MAVENLLLVASFQWHNFPHCCRDVEGNSRVWSVHHDITVSCGTMEVQRSKTITQHYCCDGGDLKQTLNQH